MRNILLTTPINSTMSKYWKKTQICKINKKVYKEPNLTQNQISSLNKSLEYAKELDN